ncbi:MAG: hypothetical protein FJY80_08545 [Candidatus Aminicenantes bacterium]|nr:hypothetical protein [Candidatus Aminicenantes bacterium]
MRKWLVFGLALAAVYVFTKFNTKKNRARYPRLKRIDQAVNITVIVISAAYLVAFLVWLLK